MKRYTLHCPDCGYHADLMVGTPSPAESFDLNEDFSHYVPLLCQDCKSVISLDLFDKETEPVCPCGGKPKKLSERELEQLPCPKCAGKNLSKVSTDNDTGQRPFLAHPPGSGPPAPVYTRGLEDVIAAETRVGYVDGVNGKLYYAGYDLNDLAGKVGFEEVVYLLWNDRLPNKKQLAALRNELVKEMELPAALLSWLKSLPRKTPRMVMLRSAVSSLAIYDPDRGDNSMEANRRKAVRLVAQVPVIIASFRRIRAGGKILEPDRHHGIAVNFLRMFLGRELEKEEAEAIELMFVLHAEHGFNASTFSARVTVSTLSDMYAGITSALATLQGPLHGGANQRVMEMLSDIGSTDEVDEYLEGMLARKERIMGFGHRVYKVEDPRAGHLRKVAARLCARDRQCEYYRMSELIERKVLKEKNIYPNVDFYSATVQHALKIPVEYYTTIFAAARVAGWSAHVLEQLADNRLMRPRSRFVGRYPRKFVPLSRRQ